MFPFPFKWKILSVFSVMLLLLVVLVTAGGGLSRQAVAGFWRPFLSAGEYLHQNMRRFTGALAVGHQQKQQRIYELEKQVYDLQLELTLVEGLAAENRQLRRLLTLPEPLSWQRVTAPVIARDPMVWDRRFRIGKGAGDGVVVGAAVMAGGVVIGRVSEAGGRSAVVTTLADPSCHMSVRVRGADAVGVLVGRRDGNWQRPPRCVIDYLPRDAVYRVAQVVETSGLGGTIPAGLRVGRLESWGTGEVVQVRKTSYARAMVCPDASFGNLGHVSVLVKR